MTTSGHEESTLTQSGFLMATLVVGTGSKEWITTGSTENTRKVTPTSPPKNANLSDNQLNAAPQIRHLTHIFRMNLMFSLNILNKIIYYI